MVREYVGKYQAQVLDLILHIQQKEYNISVTEADQPDLFEIESHYQTGKGNFWLALHEGKVVGTISLLDIGNNQVALKKVFVNKNYRGARYQTASLLLQTVMDWAKEHAIQAMFLGTTTKFIAAHRFYEKNGFTGVERQDLPDNFPAMEVDKVFYKYVFSSSLQNPIFQNKEVSTSE